MISSQVISNDNDFLKYKRNMITANDRHRLWLNFSQNLLHMIFLLLREILFLLISLMLRIKKLYMFFLLYLYFLTVQFESKRKHYVIYFKVRKINILICMHRTWAETHSTAICYSVFWKRRKINTFIEFVDSCVMTRHSWMLQLLHTCVISNKWSVHIFCAGETLITQCKRDHHAFTLYDVVAN